jgi:hypothetical protein
MDQLVIKEDGELDTRFGEPAIIREIKARKVKWMGHLIRSNEHHPVEC